MNPTVVMIFSLFTPRSPRVTPGSPPRRRGPSPSAHAVLAGSPPSRGWLL